MSGNIIRVQKPEKYAVVSQDMLRDSRLSFAARGLLSYLLSKPHDWEMRTDDLISQSPAGRDAVYAILKELETHGYLKRERVRDDQGHVSWQTTVFESPDLAAPYRDSPDTVKPDTGKPDTAPPNTGKPHSKELPKGRNNSAQPTASQSAGRKSPISQLPQKDRNILETWRATTKTYPQESTWPTVLARLRDNFDPEKLRRCGGAYLVYNGKGQKHVGGILDWYDRNQVEPERNGHEANSRFNQTPGKPPVTRDYSKFDPASTR